MTALVKQENLDEIFRREVEQAINQLLQTELTAFLDY